MSTEKINVALSEEWTPCVKLPVVVHVRKQRLNEQHVSTREGITPVRSDDLIMRGVAGEEYPIGRDLWEQTYTTNITLPDTAAMLAEKDALLRQALEALELPCDRWNAVQYKIVSAATNAIRNHLGVEP